MTSFIMSYFLRMTEVAINIRDFMWGHFGKYRKRGQPMQES